MNPDDKPTTSSGACPLLLLIDGYSLIFRAFYSMGDMKAADGTSTGALYGFLLMLIKAIDDLNPDYLLIALDSEGPTFRHQEYIKYKAHRDAAPEELREQLRISRELMESLGMAFEEMPGYEADDIIGTIAQQCENKGWDVRILTGDSDLGQLASERITVIQMLKGVTENRILDRETMRERYGIKEPVNLTDYKGLVGDPSDNIPGVAGIGEKTAKKLLADYPTIEEIYKNLDKIEEKIRKKLVLGEESARLSKHLATIRTDLPIKINAESSEKFRYDFSDIEMEHASELFTRLGFRSLMAKFGLYEAAEEPPEGFVLEHKIVDAESDLEKLIQKIRKKGRFALDFETDDLDARVASLVGVACAIDGKTGYYIPAGHIPSITDRFKKQLSLKVVIDAFKPIWEDPKIEKICQNGKFEWLVCRHHGAVLRGIFDDPMVADYLLDPDNRHGLKEMAMREFNWEMTRIEDLIGKRGKKQQSMADVPIEDAAQYAAADAVAAFRLAGEFRSRLINDGLDKLYREVELPLVPILAEMEAVGIRLNADVLSEMAVELDQRMKDVSGVIFQTIGEEFNLNSPKQLAEILFEKMKIPTVRGHSTDAEVLEKLSVNYEIAEMILEYRSLSKLRGTYTQNLIDLIDKKDGRIHTSYNQTVTSTGRLSSSDPNLQNIPIRTEIGRGIRKAFEPNYPDHLLLSADYSQIELRLLAHFTEDSVLVNAFKNDEDIHRRTAMEVFDVKAEEVSGDMRRSAKVINFGILYGMGPDGLSKALKKSRRECGEFIDKFFKRYPGVRAYLDNNIKFGRENGYVTTILGRRKYYSDLNSRNRMIQAAAERAAINMPLQGSAADIIKLAMVKLHSLLIEKGVPESILLQVHDELVLSIPENRLEELAGLIGTTMCEIIPLHIPLVVNCKAGKNWLDMESAGDYKSQL